ncbi:MAG: F0F1 ATP synthase subunit epsilon [Acidimicrobiales bacterium]
MPDEDLFALDLVTPERVLVSDRVKEVVLRDGVGDVTFLAGHTPLIGSVEPGLVRLTVESGDVVRIASHGGFVQVEYGVELATPDEEPRRGTRVTMLLGVAELAEEIDVERARVALEVAEARLADLGSSGRTSEGDAVDPEVAEAEGERLRAQTRLDVVQEPSTTGA